LRQIICLIGLIKFATSPGDVCAVGDSEVIVCLPDTMRLKHEKIDNNKIVPGEVLTGYSFPFN
jgi:hypothetical protein